MILYLGSEIGEWHMDMVFKSFHSLTIISSPKGSLGVNSLYIRRSGEEMESIERLIS